TDSDGTQRMAELVRIIDYKSSRKEINFNKVLNGLQLQLFAYMDSYTQAYPESRPAAVLYFNLSPNVTELPIGEEEPPRTARLGGVAVEGRMEGGEGIAQITADEMKTVLDYVRLSMRRTARDISRGKMPVSPARSDNRLNCEYCPHMSVCRFDVWGGERCVRNIPSAKGNEGIAEMAEEVKNNEA
ncbi:MAG: PD-(D/E)XK nuclease family protein, partial [Clostridia bacterium]